MKKSINISDRQALRQHILASAIASARIEGIVIPQSVGQEVLVKVIESLPKSVQ